MRHPGWEWTVLSLCRADDPDRSAKFKAVCKRLGVKPIISDLDDGEPMAAIDIGKDVGDRIRNGLGGTDWDLCITHGENGEYGHRRHREIHAAVLKLVAEGTLQCDRLWTFAYECDNGTSACKPALWADILVELTDEELGKKKRIVHEEYGYAEDSFEVAACISPESFRRVKGGGKEVEL